MQDDNSVAELSNLARFLLAMACLALFIALAKTVGMFWAMVVAGVMILFMVCGYVMHALGYKPGPMAPDDDNRHTQDDIHQDYHHDNHHGPNNHAH